MLAVYDSLSFWALVALSGGTQKERDILTTITCQHDFGLGFKKVWANLQLYSALGCKVLSHLFLVSLVCSEKSNMYMFNTLSPLHNPSALFCTTSLKYRLYDWSSRIRSETGFDNYLYKAVTFSGKMYMNRLNSMQDIWRMLSESREVV